MRDGVMPGPAGARRRDDRVQQQSAPATIKAAARDFESSCQLFSPCDDSPLLLLGTTGAFDPCWHRGDFCSRPPARVRKVRFHVRTCARARWLSMGVYLYPYVSRARAVKQGVCFFRLALLQPTPDL